MKIALLSPITWPIPSQAYGPWEKVVYTLAQGLVQKGHDVTVYATKNTKGDFRVQSFLDETLSENDTFGSEKELFHIVESIKHMKTQSFDIVNNHLFDKGHACLEQSGLHFATTLHGNTPESNYIFNKYKTSNYISISHSLKKYNPALHYIATIYNGIDFEVFTLNAKKEDYLVSTSRIHPDKGISEAIELAKRTKRKLYIAGPIHDQGYYNAISKDIDGEQIVYMGNINQKEIQQLVSKAYAKVSLIHWEEPFGLSVAESIACGTPVIATKRGSMPELIRDGISGILVNNVDEAVSRIEDLNMISSQKCRAFGKELFSIEAMIDQYITTFENLIQ